jgi:hypothetical protein
VVVVVGDDLVVVVGDDLVLMVVISVVTVMVVVSLDDGSGGCDRTLPLFVEFDDPLLQVDAAEMERLLRQGAYAMMSDDKEVTAFCEEDIDSILSQRSRKVDSCRRS